MSIQLEHLIISWSRDRLGTIYNFSPSLHVRIVLGGNCMENQDINGGIQAAI